MSIGSLGGCKTERFGSKSSTNSMRSGSISQLSGLIACSIAMRDAYESFSNPTNGLLVMRFRILIIR